MAEVIFRLPSKAVQYGYAEVSGTAEELAAMDFDRLGRDYLHSVAAFWTGELNARQDGPSKASSAPIRDETYEANIKAHPHIPIPGPGVSDELADAVEHELSHEDAQKLISEGLDEKAPWEETVTADPKPWEKKSVTTVKPAVGDLF